MNNQNEYHQQEQLRLLVRLREQAIHRHEELQHWLHYTPIRLPQINERKELLL